MIELNQDKAMIVELIVEISEGEQLQEQKEYFLCQV